MHYFSGKGCSEFLESMHYCIGILNKIRIREAIRLLKSGDYKVYEIAERTGYNNYAYFYQLFKKYTGVSPKDYV